MRSRYAKRVSCGRNGCHTARATFLLAAAIATAGAGVAQERATSGSRTSGANGTSVRQVGDLPLESVEVKSGSVYRGLVQWEGEQEIEFMEIVRPPGRPMYLVIRPVAIRDIVQLNRVPERQQQRLVQLTNHFRRRVLIEAGRMDRVVLDKLDVRGVPHSRYVGKWFTLLSSADEETTRRCIVRIEQIFRAYRAVVLPRTSPRRPLVVLLLGSMDEYHTYLRRHGLSLENPSFYLAHENRIVAASELTRFARHLAECRARHEQIRKTYEKLDADLPQRLQRLTEQLRLRGYNRKEIVTEVQAQQNAWAREQAAMLDNIQETDRRNDRQFAELTRQMFPRLYHEAFHAYLENYVYPHDRYHVPRWLNEGLAQIFERGQLDGDRLRIDTPDRQTLLAVQDMLAADQALSLDQLLWSNETDFLTAQGGTSRNARQTYFLSWALAYYLTFLADRPIWGTAELDEYVTPDDRDLSPVVRFERLVGMPLPKFESKWREAILALKPAPR